MNVRILQGDCREVMRTLAENSIDAIVTDPPYELGFMGKSWDRSGVAFQVETWAAALRALKPGGHLLAFGGTRTYHRMVCAIEDAGFEVRDQIGWCFASGFPKSMNLDNERGGRICGCDDPLHRLRQGSNDAGGLAAQGQDAELQPPMQREAARTRVGEAFTQRSLRLDGGKLPQQCGEDQRAKKPSVEGWCDHLQEEGQLRERALREGAGLGAADGAEGRLRDAAPADDGRLVRVPADADGSGAPHRPQPTEQRSREPRTVAGQPEPQARGAWPVCGRCGLPVLPRGLGTALKPAWEPICMARKPLDGTVAENVLAHGTGALNIDGCRVPYAGTEDAAAAAAAAEIRSKQADRNTEGWGMRSQELDRDTYLQGSAGLGRWPANLIHDGSDEVVALFPREAGAAAPVHTRNGDKFRNAYGAFAGNVDEQGSTFHGDTGSAARFFASFPSEAQCHSQQSAAPTVAQALSLQSALSASVQSAAAIWPSLAGIVSSDWTAPSTSVTPSESRTIYELATATMGSFVSESSREQRHEKLTPCGSRVNVAATREPTGITTITASLSKSDGSAVRATFTITPTSMDRGEVGSRFRYCAKASREDRNEGLHSLPARETKHYGQTMNNGSGGLRNGDGSITPQQNFHPTVKPTDLMRWLVRLITPPGGLVLDPFMGSGSTLKAAELEGFSAIGIELNPDYIEIARRRIASDAPLFAEVTA